MERFLRRRRSPTQTALDIIKDGSLAHEVELDVRFISTYKGRGVFATKDIEKGTFILEYRGEHVSCNEGERRLLLPEVGSFLFFIGNKLCIDASLHSGKGKLINDSVQRKNANCLPKLIDGHLCVFAWRDIKANEELLYYYGETERNMYWRLGEEPECYFTSDATQKDLVSATCEESTTQPKTNNDISESDSDDAAEEEVDDHAEYNDISESDSDDAAEEEVDDHAEYATQKDLVSATCEESTTQPKTNNDISESDSDDAAEEEVDDHAEYNDISESDSDDAAEEEVDDHAEYATQKDLVSATCEESTTQPKTNNDISESDSDDAAEEEVDDHAEYATQKYLVSATCEESTTQPKTNNDISESDSDDAAEEEVDDHAEYNDISESDSDDAAEEEVDDHAEYATQKDLVSSAGEKSTTLPKTNVMNQGTDGSTNDGFDSDNLSFTESLDDSLHDPDYIVKDSCSSDSDTSEIIKTFPALKRKITSEFDNRKKPRIQVEEVASFDKDVSRSADRTDPSSSGIEVQQSKNSAEHRKWDKVHYCLFCDDYSSTNIRKHYMSSLHVKETEVQRVLSYPSGSKDRNLAWEKLRNSGDYKHNTEVLRKGEGVFITITRNSEPTSANDYLPCEFCLGFFLRWGLWRHQQTCRFNKNPKKGRNVQAEARLLLPSSIKVSRGLKEDVISRMSGDKVSLVVRNDPIIIKVGEKLYKKHGSQRHLHTHISQKMRELGRFLVKAKEYDNEIVYLSDIIDAKKFRLVITVTNELCQYDDKTNKYRNPSLALKLGHLLKKAAKILRTESMIEGDSGQKDKAIEFLSVCEEEWMNEVSFSALHTLTDNKRNKKKILPLSEYISKLQTHLLKISESSADNFKDGFSKDNWELLNKVTLAKLVLFNRRRGGETERMTVKQYENRRNRSEQAPKEVEESLSETEKVLLKTLSRVEIRGKRDRTVAVLLTDDIQRNINLLLRYRTYAGVKQENEYVFARANFRSLFPLRSADVLRQFAKEANLECPENITSTKLRKHVATVVQILNLGKNDLEVLARFMGHDINIHKSFYRLPQEVIEVARMGRLLTAFNKGTIGQFNGKSIDDINLELDNDISESDSDDAAEEEVDDHAEYATQKDLVSATCEESTTQPKTIIKLTEAQQSLLKNLFKANVEMRRELQKSECDKVCSKYPALQNLSWKKVKNTVHNWIMAEKRKTKKIFT